jgi:hypothetical protein
LVAQQLRLASRRLHNILNLMADRSTFELTRAPLPVRVLNKGGQWFDRVAPRSLCWSAAELIETAKRRTGVHDFGGGEFFEPLSRLLESCYRDGRLNLIGKIALRADIIHTLDNRLLLQRDRHDCATIAAQPIRKPVFIVGLPRSGTTVLHILLAADPANRTPLTWEVMSPSPPTELHRQERIARARNNLSKLRWLAPTFETVHTMDADLPQECVSLMSPSFLSDQFDTMYNVPSYRAWFLKQDLRPAYEFHRRFLQHLQERDPRQRWVLKAPAHMFGAGSLLSVYPDACFIQTHRNPIDALASVSSLIAILRAVFSDHIDPIQIGRDATDYWSEAITNFGRAREQLAPDRVLDLDYRDIRRDPIGVVHHVYRHFNWPLPNEIEQRMRAALARQSVSRAHGSHRYDPSQFGIDSNDSFAGYSERFGLERKDAARATPDLLDRTEQVEPC